MPRTQFTSKASRETYVELTKVLQRFGISDFQLDATAKHPAVTFHVNDQDIKFPFAGTSNNWNQTRVSRANLAKKLRALGLQEIEEVETDDDVEMQATDLQTDQHVNPPPPVTEPPPIEPQVVEQVVEPQGVEQVVEAEAEPLIAEVQAEQPSTQQDWMWDDSVVQFANKPLTYYPRPRNPVLIFQLDRDLVAERGHHLMIDPNIGMVRVLSPREVDACFRPAPVASYTLQDALNAISKPQTGTAPPPMQKQTTQTQTTSQVDEKQDGRKGIKKGRVHGVGLQFGRVIVIMHVLHQRHRTDLLDTASVTEALHHADAKSVSSQIFVAQQEGYVDKVGPIPDRRGFYYRLTQQGRELAHKLGIEPFTAAGQRPPQEIMPMAAE